MDEGGNAFAGAPRDDGRSADQLRALSCARGELERADGSARWSAGGTTVLAAVYGPVETVASREDAERAVVEVVWRPLSGVPGPAEAELEAAVRGAVEGALLATLHPRTVVQVVLQVVADDGGLLAAALNAACAALLDAGVPLAHMLGAAAVAAADAEGAALAMDPTAAEEAAAAAVGTFAFGLPTNGALPEEPPAAAVVRLAGRALAFDGVHVMLCAGWAGSRAALAFHRLCVERAFGGGGIGEGCGGEEGDAA